RVLPVGPDHAGGSAAGEDAQAHARSNHTGAERQPLPLRNVRAHRARRGARRARGGVAMAIEISRREFVVAATAGLTFAFALDLGRAGRVARASAQSAGLAPNIWVTINPDDTITIVSAAVEMGQGSMTGMPVVVAEEFDADWSKVKAVPPPSNPAYGNLGLGGAQIIAASRARRSCFMPLRLAGAQARRVLLDAVAAEWNVPVDELTTEPSVVVHQRSGRRISYGDVTKFAKLPAELPKMTPADLKKPAQF